MSLNRWYKIARVAEWETLADVRSHFPHCDIVTVGSGKQVQIFNIGGNNWRMVTAIHYNRGIIHILRIMTHVEYDKNRWKKEL